MMEKHFCTCPVTECKRHPFNHDQGCDPCIRDNIEKKKMPACMFRVVHDDMSEVKDYTHEGYARFYEAHRDEYLGKLGK
ncbi:DUF6485 family protein [Eubacteriales bacterium OttesenSCG-928-A19]|nr:DUF6485 family protein [Eubacteriales bacterium OttesenSCG-928-A19]